MILGPIGPRLNPGKVRAIIRNTNEDNDTHKQSEFSEFASQPASQPFLSDRVAHSQIVGNNINLVCALER